MKAFLKIFDNKPIAKIGFELLSSTGNVDENKLPQVFVDDRRDGKRYVYGTPKKKTPWYNMFYFSGAVIFGFTAITFIAGAAKIGKVLIAVLLIAQCVDFTMKLVNPRYE